MPAPSRLPAVAPGKRPRFRREMILAAAADLFRSHGFRGTSVEDIGAAVGTSGAAIYRHFKNKEDLLAGLVDRALERARADIAGALREGATPLARLEGIVRRAVAHAIEGSDVVAMAMREMRGLSAPIRKRIGREQRALGDSWVDTLRSIRPELSRAEAVAMVRGVTAMITNGSQAEGVAPAALGDRLQRMALAALLAK